MATAYDIFGPMHTLFSLTNSYALCMLVPSFCNSSVASGCAAARMTMAIMTVAERETPHWQLQGVSNEADRDGRNRAGYSLD